MKREFLDSTSFVITDRERPLLVLAANSLRAARALVREKWFIEEVCRYRSVGIAIWDGESALTVRAANAFETAELEIAKSIDLARGEDVKFVFAFLIPIDHLPQ